MLMYYIVHIDLLTCCSLDFICIKYYYRCTPRGQLLYGFALETLQYRVNRVVTVTQRRTQIKSNIFIRALYSYYKMSIIFFFFTYLLVQFFFFNVSFSQRCFILIEKSPNMLEYRRINNI